MAEYFWSCNQILLQKSCKGTPNIRLKGYDAENWKNRLKHYPCLPQCVTISKRDRIHLEIQLEFAGIKQSYS